MFLNKVVLYCNGMSFRGKLMLYYFYYAFIVVRTQTAVVTIAVDNQPSPSPTPPNEAEITPPESKKPRMESPLLPHCYSLPRSETNSPQQNQVS